MISVSLIHVFLVILFYFLFNIYIYFLKSCSFSERGKIFSKEAIRCIEIGPGGLFFTGDESGQVRVWKWLAETTTAAA